jgi:mRNA deadenylase 3'-5' endonuclease subunit Ccr4
MSTDIPISPPLRKKSLPPPNGPAQPPKTLKILTWNVAALRTIPSKLGTTEFQNKVPMNDVLSAFFNKYNVDIACIQEHKFSGWDKLDKEYACIDGLLPLNYGLS